MDPLWQAMSKYRRGKLEECVSICDQLLAENPTDSAAWLLKCKATTKINFIDDIELDEDGVGEMLLDENAMASVPRPGTSLRTPQTASSTGIDPSIRPVSQSGRPITGFVRPMSSRPLSSSNSLSDALSGNRTTTARPMTMMGREVRLGTASLNSTTTSLIDIDRINLKKFASRKGLSMALVDYLLYVQHNTTKALELCAEGTKLNNYNNWWWKNKLGKCYMKLGMLRDAEAQFKSSLKLQPIINTYLDLCNVYIRLDVPNTALDLLKEASEKFSCEPRLLLGIARLYEMLNDMDKANIYHKEVLQLDATNIESIACLGAHCFYSDQPEVAIRYYRRLLQMGVNNAEIWNNIGLCCFYSSQYDMALNCFDRALALASDDDCAADIWYNIGHLGISLGDLGLSYQAFKICLSIDPNHAEALNNIGILELKRQKIELVKACILSSKQAGPHLYEPWYNAALIYYRSGEFQESYSNVKKALSLYPEHVESKELLSLLMNIFTLS